MQQKPDPEKQRYRKLMKERLHAMSPGEYLSCNREVRRRFFDLQPVKTAAMVMMYYSIWPEVETISMIEELLQAGKRVALPVCTPEQDLIVKEIRNLAEVRKTGKFGLCEPAPETPGVENEGIDLIVLPGLAFDHQGNRLGHGAGYYDRFLSRMAESLYKLGLAYDFQIVGELPAVKHDIKINGLLTPGGFIDFGRLTTRYGL